jgi:hypothetical protein
MIDEFEDDDFFDDEVDENGEHTNDDGEECSCMDQECGYDENEEAICPECDSTDFELVCGDHGCRCTECGATFCCP